MSTCSSSEDKSFIQSSSLSKFSSETNSLADSKEVSISSSCKGIEEKSNPCKVSSNEDSLSSVNSFSQLIWDSFLLKSDLSFSKLSNKSSRFLTSNSSTSSGILILVSEGAISCSHPGISAGWISSSTSSYSPRSSRKLSPLLLEITSSTGSIGGMVKPFSRFSSSSFEIFHPASLIHSGISLSFSLGSDGNVISLISS